MSDIDIKKENDKLDKLKIADDKLQESIRSCLNNAKALSAKLQLYVVTNPSAVAEFFDIALIKSPSDGEVLKNDKGQVKGYYKHVFFEVDDSNLENIVSSYSAKTRLICKEGR